MGSVTLQTRLISNNPRKVAGYGMANILRTLRPHLRAAEHSLPPGPGLRALCGLTTFSRSGGGLCPFRRFLERLVRRSCPRPFSLKPFQASGCDGVGAPREADVSQLEIATILQVLFHRQHLLVCDVYAELVNHVL